MLQRCGNHTVAIHQTLVEDVIGKEIVSAVTNFVVMMRSGGFLLRCLSGLLPVILGGLRPVVGHADPSWHAVAQYVMNHSIYYHEKYKRGYSGGGFEQSRNALIAAWKMFFYWFNGRLDVEGIFFHHVDVTGISITDLMTMALGMTKAIMTLFLRVPPPRPEAGKWTKIAPGFDFLIGTMVPNMVIKELLIIAKQSMKTTVQNFNGDWSKLSFSESQSVRHRDAVELTEDADKLFSVRLRGAF